jgi:hypothetical protein
LVDVVGLARALVIEPTLANQWERDQKPKPKFPRFAYTPEGGVTAWYTMRLTEIGAGIAPRMSGDLIQDLSDYEARDSARTDIWNTHFGQAASNQSARFTD